jgi:hypothetical protein
MATVQNVGLMNHCIFPRDVCVVKFLKKVAYKFCIKFLCFGF